MLERLISGRLACCAAGCSCPFAFAVVSEGCRKVNLAADDDDDDNEDDDSEFSLLSFVIVLSLHLNDACG